VLVRAFEESTSSAAARVIVVFIAMSVTSCKKGAVKVLPNGAAQPNMHRSTFISMGVRTHERRTKERRSQVVGMGRPRRTT
jgi:hypothetical protein